MNIFEICRIFILFIFLNIININEREGERKKINQSKHVDEIR